MVRRRVISVELIPEVKDACLDDLANCCLEKTDLSSTNGQLIFSILS